MANDLLATVGTSLANLGGAIAECVRADVQNTPSPTHVEHFEQCVSAECRNLRIAGQDALADALERMQAPLVRLMREGW